MNYDRNKPIRIDYSHVIRAKDVDPEVKLILLEVHRVSSLPFMEGIRASAIADTAELVEMRDYYVE